LGFFSRLNKKMAQKTIEDGLACDSVESAWALWIANRTNDVAMGKALYGDGRMRDLPAGTPFNPLSQSQTPDFVRHFEDGFPWVPIGLVVSAGTEGPWYVTPQMLGMEPYRAICGGFGIDASKFETHFSALEMKKQEVDKL
jgi:hypothetical protein